MFVRGSQAWSGGTSGALFHFGGSAWKALSSPVSGQVVSLFGPSSGSGSPLFGLCNSSAVGVPVSELLLSSDGKSFAKSPTSPPGSGYTKLWGASSGELWAVGESGRIAQWNGTSWSSPASPSAGPLSAVWGSGASDVWAVGVAGTVLHYSGSLASWNKVAVPTTVNLTDVHGTSPRDLWVVGESGTVLHFDGSRWVAEPSGSTDALWGVWAG